MKRPATAKLPVSLVQFCTILVSTLVMLVILGATVDFTASAAGIDRGYLTNSQELIYIRTQASRGVEPFASRVNNFMSTISAPTAWAYGTAGYVYTGEDYCISAGSDTDGAFLRQRGGAQGVYEKMIAYYLTGNIDYAIVARQKILDLTRSSNFGGNVYSGANNCIIELGFAIPLWIQAADLLEPTSIWTTADKRQFQNWLATQVYHKLAWASAVRNNNWGAAGSLGASMIGDYLSDTTIILNEVKPVARSFSPSQAAMQANANQLARMNTVWKGDTQCTINGIRPYGGIPDELRRGTTGCLGQWLLTNDTSFTYQIVHVEHLVFHAEYLSRRGNLSLYNNMAADGSGSLLKAIIFVIANPLKLTQSFDWTTSKRGVLFVANTFYRNAAITAELVPSHHVRRGAMIAFAELTHVVDIVGTAPIATATATTVVTNTSVPAMTSTPRPTNTSVPALTSTPRPTNTSAPVMPTTVATNTPKPPATATTAPTQMPPLGSSSTVTLNPVADAYVASDTATSNYGTAISLRTDSSPTTRNYLRFTVPAFTGTVVSARLRMYTKSTLDIGYSVHTTNSAWAENTINFNNAPTFSPVLALSLPGASSTWVEVPLAGLITVAGDYNFVVASSSSTSTAFTSRESTSNRPQLVIVVSGVLSSGSGTIGVPDNSQIILPSATPMASATVPPTSTAIATTVMPTSTTIATELPTNTAMPSNTAIPTELPTNTAIPTEMPTNTAIPTEMPTNTAIPTEMPTSTPMPTEVPAATQGS